MSLFHKLWRKTELFFPNRSRRRHGRCRSGGLDLSDAVQHEALRASRVAHEGLGSGDVLHAVPSRRERHRERNARRRQSIQRVGNNHRGKEGGSPHIWFFVAMQKAIEETLARMAGNAPDYGKAEAMKVLRTTIENTKFPELDTWVKARRHLPTHGKTSQVADHLRRRRFLLPTSGRSSKERVISTSVYTAGRGHGSAGRAPEEEDKHRRLDQARHATL